MPEEQLGKWMDKEKDLVHPDNEGFVERVTPREIPENVFLFKCTKCEGAHFRHAGYVEVMIPFMRAGGEKRVGMESVAVKVCVACLSCFAWINEQMYDVSDQIDIEAWIKAEQELHRATGPGGNC